MFAMLHYDVRSLCAWMLIRLYLRVCLCVCLLTEQDFVLEEVGRDPDADCGW